MTATAHSTRTPAGLPLREGRAPVRDRLLAMLFLTALLHAIVILGVGFNAAGRGGGKDAPQLDVVLVTNEVPEARANPHAAYLAQRTQIGAGDTDEQRPPGSPASRGALTAAQTDTGADLRDSEHPQQALSDERVLASTGASPDIRYFGEQPDPSQAASPEPLGDTPGAPRSGSGDAVELLLRGKSNAEHWVSPDTRASVLAPYLASWKRKVERVGSLNFPSAARRAGLSGSPVVEVEIAADGRLRQARVRRSSGYGALDQAALTILHLASPFNPFPAALAEHYSRLRFAYQWDFVAGALQTSATAPDNVAAPDSVAGPNSVVPAGSAVAAGAPPAGR